MLPTSVRNCGVSERRTSSTGAKAEMISDSGAVISFRPPLLFPSAPLLVSLPASHVVFIDIESLPTGIATPSALHSSTVTAFTVA